MCVEERRCKMIQSIGTVIIGLLFALDVSIAYKYPSPAMIGCTVLVGCLFLFNLVLLVKG